MRQKIPIVPTFQSHTKSFVARTKFESIPKSHSLPCDRPLLSLSLDVHLYRARTGPFLRPWHNDPTPPRFLFRSIKELHHNCRRTRPTSQPIFIARDGKSLSAYRQTRRGRQPTETSRVRNSQLDSAPARFVWFTRETGPKNRDSEEERIFGWAVARVHTLLSGTRSTSTNFVQLRSRGRIGDSRRIATKSAIYESPTRRCSIVFRPIFSRVGTKTDYKTVLINS